MLQLPATKHYLENEKMRYKLLLFFLLSTLLIAGGWHWQAPPPETDNPNGYMYQDEALNDAYLEASELLSAALSTEDEPKRRELLQATLEIYTQLLQERPNDIGLLLNRGAIYTELGMYEQGIEDYNQAFALQPKSIDALYGRGLAYKRSGRVQLAWLDYESILKMIEDLEQSQANAGALDAHRQKAELLRAQLDK